MHWYYEERGQQIGPITEEQFQDALRAGRISDATLVWNETLSNWTAYGLLPHRPPVLPPQSPNVPLQNCSQCSKMFPQQDLIQYGGLWVCANCKPVFFQRLKEDGRVAAIWREGKLLVASKDAVLPDRCVKCNVPTREKRMKKFYWHPPAFYLFICTGILIYAIIAIIVRKNSTVHLGICPEHTSKRLRSIAIAWSLVGLSVILVVGAIAGDSPEFGLLSAVLLLGAIIYGVVSTQILTPARIDAQGTIWLKGVPAAYLEGLPEYKL